MSEFLAYFQVGYQHITNILGYDHILFVIALCAIYEVADWKKVLLLITAFTIGHSVTLALATFSILTYRVEVIEFLIPITILFTCITNFFYSSSETQSKKRLAFRYPLAMLFGLIHGMGFSTYLRSLLGKDENIVSQLLAFNLGLEAGQILIVMLAMIMSYFLVTILKIPKKTLNLIVSGFVACVAFKLIVEKWVF